MHHGLIQEVSLLLVSLGQPPNGSFHGAEASWQQNEKKTLVILLI